MPITVTLTDGRVATFPDGTSQQEMEQALSQVPPMAASHEQRPASPAPMVNVGGRGTGLDVRKSQQRMTDALPTIGSGVGAAVGGLTSPVTGPVGPAAGAALGGAAGTALRSVAQGQMPDANEVIEGGLMHGSLQAVAPVGDLVGRGIYKGSVALLPKSLKQEFPSLAKAGYREGIALTRRGADKAERLATTSADEADGLIRAREAARPRVAGLLPEGRVAVPLGQAPVPTGGAPSLSGAAMTQARKEGSVGNAEELLQRRWTPVYGGTTRDAVGARADVVSGPGTILLPMNAPPGVGKVPGMVSIDEALAHVPSLQREIASGALGAKEPGLQQVRRLVELTRTGRQWPMPLTTAQALKRTEQTRAHNAYRAVDRGVKTEVSPRARYAKAVAQGTREAVEREVPEVGAVNARTQELLGLNRAAEHASNTGHILSRIGGVAGGAMLASPGGAMPAVGGALVGSLLTTPGGLSRLGLGLGRTAQAVPDAGRLAMLLSLLQD